MPASLLYLLMPATCVLAIVCLWLLAERRKTRLALSSLNDRHLVLESKQASPAEMALKRKAKSKERDEGAQKDLIESRRDVSKLKDELKKVKEDLKERESSLRVLREDSTKKMLTVETENKVLLEELRSKDRQSAAPNKVTRPEPVAAAVMTPVLNDSVEKAELMRTRQRSADLERQLMAELDRRDAMQHRLETLQQELRKWRETSTLMNGKTLDPVEFLKWRERAMEGKRMYNLMLRLRELSDEKLAIYQVGVEKLSLEALRMAGRQPPEIKPGELKVDRYFAAALDAFRSEDASTLQ